MGGIAEARGEGIVGGRVGTAGGIDGGIDGGIAGYGSIEQFTGEYVGITGGASDKEYVGFGEDASKTGVLSCELVLHFSLSCK